jgi:hypothetical protein
MAKMAETLMPTMAPFEAGDPCSFDDNKTRRNITHAFSLGECGRKEKSEIWVKWVTVDQPEQPATKLAQMKFSSDDGNRVHWRRVRGGAKTKRHQSHSTCTRLCRSIKVSLYSRRILSEGPVADGSDESGPAELSSDCSTLHI